MVISILCHIAALAWVVHDRDVLAPLHVQATAAPPAPPPPPPRDTEPIELVLLDARAEPTLSRSEPAPVAGATEARPRDPGAPAISIDRTGGTELPRAEADANDGARPGRGVPGRSRWMTMRGGESPGFALPEEFLRDFLAHSKPVPPPPDIPGERIGNEIKELRQRMRRARLEEVGALRLQLIAAYDALAAEDLKASGRGTYRAEQPTFSARVEADGSIHLKDKPGALDSQDKLMLSKGIDPYAREKLALLDRTRDQRVAVGQRWRREQLTRATELMLANIDRLWATTPDLAARKVGLFELWDDCAETGDDEVVAGAAAARALVIGVIRARLRGNDAYTNAELAIFNAHRSSIAVFAPYD
jgi:hypothetical protein